MQPLFYHASVCRPFPCLPRRRKAPSFPWLPHSLPANLLLRKIFVGALYKREVPRRGGRSHRVAARRVMRGMSTVIPAPFTPASPFPKKSFALQNLFWEPYPMSLPCARGGGRRGTSLTEGLFYSRSSDLYNPPASLRSAPSLTQGGLGKEHLLTPYTGRAGVRNDTARPQIFRAKNFHP